MSTNDERSAVPRREVLKLGAVAAAGFLARGAAAAEPRDLPPLPSNGATAAAMPTRNLGRTGYRVGLFSLGGQAALEQPNNEARAVPLIEKAIDLGVNYVDTSARYGGEQDRWSERYFGQVLKRRRKEVFVATKTHDRTRDGSLRHLERSLQLLQTDHIDLWQLHNLARKEEIDQIFAPGGALEALIQARDQKIVRHLGITGHADPAVLLEAMERFPFDAILLALNAADRHHLPFAEKLLPRAVEKEMAIIGMKIPSRGLLLSSWKPPSDPAARFYGASPGPLVMREALRYVLSLPVSTVIVGVDSIAQLEENVEIARSFVPVGPVQMAEMEQRTASVRRQALFFRRWEA